MAVRGLLLCGLVTVITISLAVVIAASGQQKREMKQEERDAMQQRQRFLIYKAALECRDYLANLTTPDGVYCDAVFDSIMCWPYSPAGTVARKPCPAIIFNFNTAEYATRICQEDGTWGPPPPDANRSNIPVKGWTNYSACQRHGPSSRHVPVIIKEHMPVINLISRIGYSISLVSLAVATFIMVKIKRLHCQRNVIHINLFVTFIVRAVICLLRDSLLVQGLGLPKDIRYDQDGDIEFNPYGPHWECKLLFTLFYWSLCSNYMWIFVEGLYLHTLIFFAVFDQKVIFKWYIVIGWVTPFCFVLAWLLVRIFHNDTLCWNTHEDGYYWILNGPIVITICMNFFFFLNIVRVLYTKLRASTSDDSHRYRKLAKSTLVLIPLFGVYYIFFIIITNQNHRHAGLEVGLFYAEMTLNSFQGMVVAILFCFTNGEVRSELTKRWQRQMLRRQSVASLRSSRAMSTTSFFLPRERPSFSGPSRRGSRFPNVQSCLSIKSMGANGEAGGGGGGTGRLGTSTTTTTKFPKPKSSPCLRSAAAVAEPEVTEREPNGGPDLYLHVPGMTSPTFLHTEGNGGSSGGGGGGGSHYLGLPDGGDCKVKVGDGGGVVTVDSANNNNNNGVVVVVPPFSSSSPSSSPHVTVRSDSRQDQSDQQQQQQQRSSATQDTGRNTTRSTATARDGERDKSAPPRGKSTVGNGLGGVDKGKTPPCSWATEEEVEEEEEEEEIRGVPRKTLPC
ncbi:glucagon-like peptide 1 receptor [Babylonia areolata]|uniref:glucagon-like peptide 1 receptor n=1 Tax=Babylonia areolata TaxID=304850 RepID=UPI003FD2D8C3